MSRANIRQTTPAPRTHEGAPAARHLTATQVLRRSVGACLLWEDEFYEAGHSIAERIRDSVKACRSEDVCAIAIEAREQLNLRHAPLWLLSALFLENRHSPLLRPTVTRVIQRADEMGEILAMYWKDDATRKVPQALKRGIADAYLKFDDYQLAKYANTESAAVTLRDVVLLCHVKPPEALAGAAGVPAPAIAREKHKKDGRISRYERGPVERHPDSTLAKIVARTLKAPDTWEAALSAGADPKETFTRLLTEEKLGYLALLRNLRNMEKAQVEPVLVADALRARKGAWRVLPFRYIAAMKHAPSQVRALDDAFQAAITELAPLPGTTAVLIDVSGSMAAVLSRRKKKDGRSVEAPLRQALPHETSRMDAAAALGVLAGGLGAARVFTFSEKLIEVPAFRGLGGISTILHSQPHGGTYLGRALELLCTVVPEAQRDRLIVITDEQSHDRVQLPDFRQTYLINVASAQNGVGYGRADGREWIHFDGFSEGVLRYIADREQLKAPQVPEAAKEETDDGDDPDE